MHRLVIIDDEQDARAVLRTLLCTYCPDVEIVGEANAVASGVALIRSTRPDIVLLDIHLGVEDGFSVIDKFSNPGFKVIFTTAFERYAIKAFRYQVFDYLLKPVDPSLLVQSIDKAKKAIEQDRFIAGSNNTKAGTFKELDKLILPSSEGFLFVQLADILFLQAKGNYSLIFTKEGEKVMATKTLKAFEERLPENAFFRTHQSYIVSIKSVRQVIREDGGYAILCNGAKIPISRRKKEAFLHVMTKWST